MLYYTILYYTILYYTILYYTILYYTILYYTVLYFRLEALSTLLELKKYATPIPSHCVQKQAWIQNIAL